MSIVNDGDEYVLAEVGLEPAEVCWRANMLIRHGVDSVDALALASQKDLDVHEAIDRLLKRGCPTGLAVKILRA